MNLFCLFCDIVFNWKIRFLLSAQSFDFSDYYDWKILEDFPIFCQRYMINNSGNCLLLSWKAFFNFFWAFLASVRSFFGLLDLKKSYKIKIFYFFDPSSWWEDPAMDFIIYIGSLYPPVVIVCGTDRVHGGQLWAPES